MRRHKGAFASEPGSRGVAPEPASAVSAKGADPSRNQEMTHEIRLKLDKRINRQRMALRENWQIVERRHWYQKVYPLHSRYLDHFARLRSEIAELRQALKARVVAERGEFYRVVRVIPASGMQLSEDGLPAEAEGLQPVPEATPND